MKRIFSHALAWLLALALMLPAAAAEAAAPCEAEKVQLLLFPQDGTALASAAAAAGLAPDDYALTEAGRAVRADAERLLDAVLTRAQSAAHCCTETTRWTAALVGLGVEVDAVDVPYLRAAGALAPEEERFAVYAAGYYTTAEEETDDTPLSVAPDFVLNVTEEPIPAAGDGTVIAILDTGFDADMSCFALPEGVSPALSGDALTARLALVGRSSADEGQDGAKIPFLYNYVDPDAPADSASAHGTRVAALAGAWRGDDFDGSAPGAQLLLMKVFGEQATAASELDILSAIDDAFLLGADVINLSLGSPAGGDGAGAGLALAAAAAEQAGIGVVAAAGNNGETGVGSFFYTRTGQTLYPVEHTDRGTIAHPASLPGVIAVGAASGSYRTTTVLLDDAGNRISYTDTCDEYFRPDNAESGSSTTALARIRDFAALVGGNAFAYVAVPGIGLPEDYVGLNVVGRVALVERGEISFIEKTQHAAEAGAIGVIVYDNNPETDGAVNMQLDDAALPAIFINIADGTRLAEAGEGMLSFPDRDPSTRGMRVQAVAGFSSRGLRDDFSFAPALVAPGDNFIGLSANDTLALLEGTSYAAAQVSGALAALIGDLREEEGQSAADRLASATALLQNSASTLTVGDLPISVRAQGAGALDLAEALDLPLLLRGNDGGAVTMTGVGSTFTLTFTAQNRTAHDLAVTLMPSVLADAYTDPLADEDPSALNELAERWLTLNGYTYATAPTCVTGLLEVLDADVTLNGTSIGDTGAVILLAPGETREIALTVTIDPDAYAERTALFTSGFIVEGQIAADADGHSLSLPFAVYCGDWSTAPLAAETAYTDGEQLYPSQTVTAALVSGYTITLGEMQGSDILRNTAVYSSALASFNPRGLAEPLTLTLCLLRNVDSYTVSVTDAAGETVYTTEGGVLRKAYRYDGAAVAQRIPLWDGSVTDNPKYICPDGRYTITLTLRGAAGGEQVLTLPVTLDTAAPELVAAGFRREGEALLFEVTVSDADYIRSLEVTDRRGYVDYDYTRFESDPILAAGRGAATTVSLDGTALYLQYVYVTVTDYAYNQTVVRLDRDLLFEQFCAQETGGA